MIYKPPTTTISGPPILEFDLKGIVFGFLKEFAPSEACNAIKATIRLFPLGPGFVFLEPTVEGCVSRCKNTTTNNCELYGSVSGGANAYWKMGEVARFTEKDIQAWGRNGRPFGEGTPKIKYLLGKPKERNMFTPTAQVEASLKPSCEKPCPESKYNANFKLYAKAIATADFLGGIQGRIDYTFEWENGRYSGGEASGDIQLTSPQGTGIKFEAGVEARIGISGPLE
jgi:hypothetical protein